MILRIRRLVPLKHRVVQEPDAGYPKYLSRSRALAPFGVAGALRARGIFFRSLTESSSRKLVVAGFRNMARDHTSLARVGDVERRNTQATNMPFTDFETVNKYVSLYLLSVKQVLRQRWSFDQGDNDRLIELQVSEVGEQHVAFAKITLKSTHSLFRHPLPQIRY